jgi:hypothetical protein
MFMQTGQLPLKLFRGVIGVKRRTLELQFGYRPANRPAAALFIDVARFF